jgi:hypothetical protein
MEGIVRLSLFTIVGTISVVVVVVVENRGLRLVVDEVVRDRFWNAFHLFQSVMRKEMWKPFSTKTTRCISKGSQHHPLHTDLNNALCTSHWSSLTPQVRAPLHNSRDITGQKEDQRSGNLSVASSTIRP